MATRSAVLLAGTLVVSHGWGAVAAEPAGDRVLELCYFSSADLGEAEVGAMRAEVERIFGAIGFEVRTYTAAQLAAAAPLDRPVLRVVIVDQEPLRWSLSPHAIGVRIGTRLPPSAVYVFEPVLRRVLGIADKRPGYMTAKEVGRAHARVVVHEIVHAYAPDHPHGGWGIMGHNQDAVSLTQGQRTLDQRTARAFVEGWERATAAGAGVAAGEGP